MLSTRSRSSENHPRSAEDKKGSEQNKKHSCRECKADSIEYVSLFLLPRLVRVGIFSHKKDRMKREDYTAETLRSHFEREIITDDRSPAAESDTCGRRRP